MKRTRTVARIGIGIALVATTSAGCATWQEDARRSQDEAYALGIDVGRARTWTELNGGHTRLETFRGPLLERVTTPERRRGAVVIAPSEQVVVIGPGGWDERTAGADAEIDSFRHPPPRGASSGCSQNPAR